MFLNNEKVLKDDGKMLLCYYWNRNRTARNLYIGEFDYIDKKDIIIIPGVTVHEDNSILLYKKLK